MIESEDESLPRATRGIIGPMRLAQVADDRYIGVVAMRDGSRTASISSILTVERICNIGVLSRLSYYKLLEDPKRQVQRAL